MIEKSPDSAPLSESGLFCFPGGYINLRSMGFYLAAQARIGMVIF
jgi:hypothetical protein